MKFAGNDKTYLSQKKVDKIKAIIESNKQNKEAAPQLNNLHNLNENNEDKKEEDKKVEDKKVEDKKVEDKKEEE